MGEWVVRRSNARNAKGKINLSYSFDENSSNDFVAIKQIASGVERSAQEKGFGYEMRNHQKEKCKFNNLECLFTFQCQRIRYYWRSLVRHLFEKNNFLPARATLLNDEKQNLIQAMLRVIFRKENPIVMKSSYTWINFADHFIAFWLQILFVENFI